MNYPEHATRDYWISAIESAYKRGFSDGRSAALEYTLAEYDLWQTLQRNGEQE